MNTTLLGKNVEITEPLKVYIDEKLSHLEKINHEILTCRVDISRDAHHHKGDIFRVEINLNVPHKLLRAVEFRPDAREAIDIAVDKMSRQLRELKGKKLSLRRFSRLLKFRK